MATESDSRQINLNRKLRTSYWLMVLAILAGAFFYGPAYSSMPLAEWIASCLVVGGFVALPLLCFVTAAHRPRPGPVSWLSFLLLAYLVYGIVLLFSPGGLIAGLMLSATTLATFTQAVLWLRPFKQAARRAGRASRR